MAFDINKAGFGKAQNSKLDSNVLIPLSAITKNEKNFYSMSEIEKLQESIQAVGLLSPITVVQTGPSQYRIISGHRRYTAYHALAEIDQKYSTIPARIVEKFDDIEETMALIFANSTQRVLTLEEKLQQEQMMRDSIKALKAAGEDTPKNIGQYIANYLGTSRNEVSRMHSINENLIPEAREKIAAGEMNASTAYQLSRKDPVAQRAAIDETAVPVCEPIEQNAQTVSDSNPVMYSVVTWNYGELPNKYNGIVFADIDFSGNGNLSAHVLFQRDGVLYMNRKQSVKADDTVRSKINRWILAVD